VNFHHVQDIQFKANEGPLVLQNVGLIRKITPKPTDAPKSL
jgi:hypothetical protein